MLTFVGVGPGDPELVTLKAARVLREADAIACTDAGRGDGTALGIASEWIAGKPVLRLRLPMRGMREDWVEAHRIAAGQLLEWLEQYPSIAYPVLGDPGMYASGSYLLRLVAPHHPCAVVPGISAANAMAAALGIPLTEQGETLTVLDHLEAGTALPEGNVVVMKCGKRLEALRALASEREVYLAHRLGGEGEWFGPLESAPDMEYSYFTTALIKARKH